MTSAPVAPTDLQAVAAQLAAEAATFVRRRRTEVFAERTDADAAAVVRSKSTPTDPVTVVDTETERLLRDRLAELRPDEPVLGEEGGQSGTVGSGRPVWVLDPIDGTVNFVYGIEAYAVSVGVQIDGESVAGAVADVATGAVYSAARGHGAQLLRDGVTRRLHCSAATELSMSLVGTGFAYSTELRRSQAQVVAALLPQVRDIRRIGSCALDLCMVAAGLLDAYYEEGVQVWDWAAAALIAAEAGARVRVPPPDRVGDPDGRVTAAAPGIDAAFHDALRAAGG
ncbi:inositol monophosphatase family protein [Mycolicibacterium thermoresistibile]